MRTLFLVSANGHGAGKSTFASYLKAYKLSLASAIRKEAQMSYSSTDWFSQDQNYKDTHEVLPGVTLRQYLVKLGQDRCEQDPTYWCKELARTLDLAALAGTNVAIDDLRKVVELDFFRDWAERNSYTVQHFHLKYSAAVAEEYDAGSLEIRADYVVFRDTRPIGNFSIGGTANPYNLRSRNYF
jgi:hypothetical protein